MRENATADLRKATEAIEKVRKLAERMFGFNAYLVTPLEADGTNPGIYCMFKVCGVEYRVENGRLPICGQDQR